MKSLYYTFPGAVLLLLLACNLTKEVEIDLPEYQRQPVVECYLEPGQPFRLLLTQSYGFFEEFGLDSTFVQKTLIDKAQVTISYEGRTDTLYNGEYYDFSTPNVIKIYNYQNNRPVPATPGIEYTLNILLPDNKNITGHAVMLPSLAIDSTVIKWDADVDTLAQVLTYFTDDPTTDNYYRRLLNYQRLKSLPDQDFLFTDRANVTPVVAFGTSYNLTEGDTVFNTVFSITKDYYDYLESIQLAVLGNANPFTQPSPVKSNVTGTGDPLGIFTCLIYDRKLTRIER
ncbi:MAG: DUF4249 domain-containing protein [Saprospiraceae bacterium]|nr:DUF4249 domain-containing protein [Saprospiraceae bacterium]